jgi:hypothetical protein
LQLLGRGTDQLAEYYRWRTELLEMYASVSDFLRQRVFGYSPTMDKDKGRLVTAVPEDEVGQEGIHTGERLWYHVWKGTGTGPR